MRLIDADVLKLSDFQDFSNTDVMSAIDSSPTLDVKPVVHAHWIDYMADKKDWLRDDGKTVFIECSVCHERLCRNLMLSEKYCPACGALMDGKDGGEK